MEFSLRTIRQYQKYVKSRRAMNSNITPNEQRDGLRQNSCVNSVFVKPQHQGLQSYHDGHLFKTNLTSIQNSIDNSRVSVFSRQKTETVAYQAYSKRKDIKRLNNTSYQLQKTQKSQKTQKALEDLIKINEISIHPLEHSPFNPIRFNKETKTMNEQQKQEQPFRRWRTLTKKKSRKSKSPSKGKHSVGKRTKNSPIKISFNLRIRKTFNNAKTQQFSLNLSTMESSTTSIQNAKPTRRKSSITPWEIDQQGLY